MRILFLFAYHISTLLHMCFNGKIYAYNLIGQIIFQNKKNCQKSLNLEATIMD